jgi:formiminoglutamate deiminase
VGATLIFRHALLPTGWAQNVGITISGGLITAVTPGLPTIGGAEAKIALPGMANVHSHTFQRAMAGLTEYQTQHSSDNFWTWRELMYRFGLRMDPDDVEAVATHAFIEMLQGGFCSVAEFHYLHHAPDGRPYADIAELSVRIAAAAQAAGISLLLLPVFYAHADFGGLPPSDGQRRFINGLDAYATLLARCQTLAPTGIAPHSLRAVTPDELTALAEMVPPGTRTHIHVSEQTAEVEACLAWSGARPVEFLLRHAPVGDNWCLIHATHANESERAAIAASGAAIGLCPLTEANLGDGIFPASEHGSAFGIGTDSNILIGVPEELRQLEYAQRLARRQRNVMAQGAATATTLYARAQAGGAQALGQPAGLAPGAPAHIIAFPGDNPDVALAQAVFASRTPVPLDVWSAGEQRITAGRHPLAERSKKRFEQVVKKLLA